MRHAVVTGTSSGIGAALARRLLEHGWKVTGLDRNPGIIQHAEFASHEVDLTDRAETLAVVRRIDGVTGLVHAAGIMRGARLGALDHDAGELLWRLHVDAAVTLADHFVGSMPSGGRIVMIGSRAAKGVVGKGQYGAAKAALASLGRTWAKELVARGITVNVVAPAATDTGMLKDPARAIMPPETPPMGRMIRPEEIAALVAFLMSESAAAITGQEIAICGGASL